MKREITLEEKVMMAINRGIRLKRLLELTAPKPIIDLERALFRQAAEAVFLSPEEWLK